MWCTWILTSLWFYTTLATENSGVPEFDLVRPIDGYHGIVSEDSTEVDVQPRILAGSNVCEFRIKARHHGEAPFEIRLNDPSIGSARLFAKRPLNCEKRKNYKFDIIALSCQGVESQNVSVHVKVSDVNEFSPIFVDPSPVIAVDEGRIYEQLLTMRAEDQDCSPKYGDICRYEILSTDQPFTISSEGTIRNTHPLDYEKSHNHILSVVAYDCGMKKSQPVIVTIKVNRVCHLGWKGVPDQVEYHPGTGRQALFPSASLDLCNVPCDVERIQSRISLKTDHIGKGCDRDTYSLARQREICGASATSVDLLPSPSEGESWTSGLHSDEGSEGDLIFQFEGDLSGVSVPTNVLSHNFTNTFTISTWLKHKSQTKDKHTKEHLLCNSDSRQMNRHHLALFVRNCRLILVVRREADEGDLNTFKPAEWRWKLPQACDNEWHHYSVAASLPEVSLYVDGHLFHPEGGYAPQVIDDWPLHPTKGVETTMSVGGCWQGSEGIMKHGLVGYMAGLNVLIGAHEPANVLSCLVRCQESLDTPAMELMQPSMELLTNNELTEITIEGSNKTNLETLVRGVSYVNGRSQPTPGRRPISMVTNILCKTGKALKVGSLESFLVVLHPHQPTININGTTNFAQEYSTFREGLRIFPDVNIALNLLEDTDIIDQFEPERNNIELDRCVLSIYPPLNPDHESLDLPQEIIDRLGLVATVTRQGATVTGSQSHRDYQDLMRRVLYTNRKPAYYLNRAFKLTCSRMDDRFVSNEYTQTVTVIHPQLNIIDQSPSAPEENKKPRVESRVHSAPSHAKVSPFHVQIKNGHVSAIEGASQAAAGHAVTLIVVVCIGFLLFLVILGVIRVRSLSTRKDAQEAQDAEMAWDDSALNITVNPMEMSLKSNPLAVADAADSSSDGEDDDENYNEDSSSEDEEIKQKDLEWDDSTLKI